MDDQEFDEIFNEASRRMRNWSRHYMCQDINIRHGIEYWVYEVTKEKLTKAPVKEEHNNEN